MCSSILVKKCKQDTDSLGFTYRLLAGRLDGLRWGEELKKKVI